MGSDLVQATLNCVRQHIPLGCLPHSALLDLAIHCKRSIPANIVALADPPQARTAEAAALERRRAELAAYDAAVKATAKVGASRLYGPVCLCMHMCVGARLRCRCVFGASGLELRVWCGFTRP
jgi:hypothetical protein